MNAKEMQPLELWSHWGAPNPWKVRMALDELDVPYATRELELSETRTAAHVAVNPNGRLPTLRDPNTGVVLWESAAILTYLIDTYDPDGKLSFATVPERYLVQQWLAFQVSGQGPYFGQATWFARFHPEKLPSAVDRYTAEMERVIGVLDEGLAREGTGWLVGGRFSVADLAFVTWAFVGEGLLRQLGLWDGAIAKFPRYKAWMERLVERPKIAAALETIAANRKAHGLP